MTVRTERHFKNVPGEIGQVDLRESQVLVPPRICRTLALRRLGFSLLVREQVTESEGTDKQRAKTTLNAVSTRGWHKHSRLAHMGSPWLASDLSVLGNMVHLLSTGAGCCPWHVATCNPESSAGVGISGFDLLCDYNSLPLDFKIELNLHTHGHGKQHEVTGTSNLGNIHAHILTKRIYM